MLTKYDRGAGNASQTDADAGAGRQGSFRRSAPLQQVAGHWDGEEEVQEEDPPF